jgi:hypothetical protein
MSRWRTILHKILPLAVSAALIAWLLSRVKLADLVQAAGELDWRLLAPLTAAMVLALYVCDASCLRTVFALEQRPLSYRQMLRVRGISYLVGAFNYELGQGFIAWNMTRLLRVDLLFTLSRSVLLAYHDLVVLLSSGLFGWLLSDGAAPRTIGTFCQVGLAVLVMIGLSVACLPRRHRQRFEATRWGAWLKSWPLSRSLKLAGLRLVYFGILIVYGGMALAICGIDVSPMVVLSTMPLVLLADALPSVAGVGTRETALLLLLNPESNATLMAMSLFWSTGMIVCRLAIGLVLLWLPESHKSEPAAQDPPLSSHLLR